MLTPYVPYPPNSGGQTRTFNLMKNLSKKHEITSFSFLRHDQPEPDISELKKYASKIWFFRRKRAFASIMKIFKTGFSLQPYLVNMYYDPVVKTAISEELSKNKYDLIHVETYYIMPNLPETDVPVLLAEQTIEYLVYQHYAQTSPWWSFYPFWKIKLLLYTDTAKHKFWEKYYWLKAKKVVAMSSADKEKMLELAPQLDVDTVPNGVDMDFFNVKVKTSKHPGHRFLFVGNFNWLQNREAVDVLAKEIWPKIKEKLADSTLWIVGRSPTEEIKKLGGNGIIVSDNIDDIREAYQGSDVLLAPLFGGGGTRYKILEAMASGLPVVSTSIGIEGLGATNEKHALISNDVEELAQLAVFVAREKTLAAKLIKEAKMLVSKTYDWGVISQKLDRIYEETAKKS